MIFVMAYSAQALDLCEDRQEIHTNCTMVTPVLNCSTYNYSIINVSMGDILENGTLTLLNNNIYYFNFTLNEGNYIVQLCDDTTREIKVMTEEKGNLIAILILLPMILGMFFLVGGVTLSPDKHPVMKIGLFFFALMTFFISAYWGGIALIRFYNFPEMQDAMSSSIYWIAIIFTTLIFYFIIYAITVMFRNMAREKEDRLEY